LENGSLVLFEKDPDLFVIYLISYWDNSKSQGGSILRQRKQQKQRICKYRRVKPSLIPLIYSKKRKEGNKSIHFWVALLNRSKKPRPIKKHQNSQYVLPRTFVAVE